MPSAQFQQLKRFHFLVRGAESEGNIAGQLQKVSIERVDASQYPDSHELAQVRLFLRQKCGVPIGTLLAEIHRRRETDGQEGGKHIRVKSSSQLAILKGEEENIYATRHSISENVVAAKPATDSPDTSDQISQGTRKDDGFWQ